MIKNLFWVQTKTLASQLGKTRTEAEPPEPGPRQGGLTCGSWGRAGPQRCWWDWSPAAGSAALLPLRATGHPETSPKTSRHLRLQGFFPRGDSNSYPYISGAARACWQGCPGRGSRVWTHVCFLATDILLSPPTVLFVQKYPSVLHLM